jgi:hypothetical protein
VRDARSPGRSGHSIGAVRRRASCAVLAGVFAAASAAGAQELSRISLDSVSAVDLFRGEGTTGNPGASVDISSVVRIGGGWSAHVRPWFFKSSANGSRWSKEIYQAAVRYERNGTVSMRLDAGFIASPIGLGMLDMRADINPTIQPHLSYFMPLLPFDRNAPGVRPIAASYPLGGLATFSTTKFDVRTAIVSSAPNRRYAVNASSGNPDHTPVVVAGGGVTAITGLRLGTSFASGRYATDREVSDPSGAARRLKMWTAEAEYAFGYTRLSAEFTRESFERGAAADWSATWFVQGVHTLSPRWFLAGRHETVDAPPMAARGAGAPRLTIRTSEGTLALRITPELLVRSSVTTVRFYTADQADLRVGAQLVWARRWW